MDLTPKNHCWRSIFDCCRPPKASSSMLCDDDEKELDLFSTVSSLKVTTTGSKLASVDEEVEHLDTPTTACTDTSDENDFNFTERLDVYDGDDEVSDPDDADYWYADSIDVDVNQSGRDLYVIPEMDEKKNEPLLTNRIVNCNDALPSLSLRQDDFDVKLFQLMALVILPGELDSCASNIQRKGSRKLIHREWENADEEFEVVPQLHRDDETTLSELLPVIELN